MAVGAWGLTAAGDDMLNCKSDVTGICGPSCEALGELLSLPGAALGRAASFLLMAAQKVLAGALVGVGGHLADMGVGEPRVGPSPTGQG